MANPVTLTVDELNKLLRVLRDNSRAQFAYASRTESAAIRASCLARGAECNELEVLIVRRMFVEGVQP